MTATPLLTGQQDITSMGCLISINHFSSPASIEEEKNDRLQLNKLKRANNEEGLTAEWLKIVVHHQDHCKGHFLCRTMMSNNFKDKPLTDIPPYCEIIVLVWLTERELEIIEVCSEAAKAERAGKEGMLPKFYSLVEWELKMSSKMEYCTQICKYLLINDHILDIICKDGEIEFPDVLEEFFANPQSSQHIIIYSEFLSLASLLQNVLLLRSIKSLAINSKTSLKDRNLAVKHLSAGLNLAIADVVILFKEVKVYYLHAMDSVDSLIWQMARGKLAMFDAFVNKKRGAELQALLQGKVLNDDNGDDPSPEEIPAAHQIITDDDNEAVQLPAVHIKDSEVLFQTLDGEENERPPLTTAFNVSSPCLSYKLDTEANTMEDNAPHESQYESPGYTDYDNTPGCHNTDPIGPKDDDVNEYNTRGKHTSQRKLSCVEDVEMEGVMTDLPHLKEDDEMEGVMLDLPHFEEDEILHRSPSMTTAH
ncbi:hypothetical protein NP233_g5133 [Leucocoprinus birnbaumii]|uniref:Uncharacterized protein n=1 Tax=Leucocoprinus birnbaumii TaxID=56174 RepID=A0AAD5VX32_9AGAR|nr:hypothetical protein NP233_g5133 [Leucocoprinus birnbaumii]